MLETIPGEDAIWSLVGDFYPESETVTDTNSLYLLLPGIEDSDSETENKLKIKGEVLNIKIVIPG